MGITVSAKLHTFTNNVNFLPLYSIYYSLSCKDRKFSGRGFMDISDDLLRNDQNTWFNFVNYTGKSYSFHAQFSD